MTTKPRLVKLADVPISERRKKAKMLARRESDILRMFELLDAAEHPSNRVYRLTGEAA
jgi:hypothetical protein